jgi:hypothetical protein
MAGQVWWGVAQWAAYFEFHDMPIRAASKQALRALEASGEDRLSGRAYACLLLDDPLLALRLLKAANQRLPPRLARDITTPLGVVLALGTVQYKEQLLNAPEVGEQNAGFIESERRASLGARIALGWGALRHDLDQGELALAALLADAGEIALWAFAPELPQKALDELRSGRATRSEQAQRQACGFSFKDLTLSLIERWSLPRLILQLVRGDEGLRAQLARLAVDAGRHLGYGAADPALPHDLAQAARLTGASLESVAACLPELDDGQRAALVDASQGMADDDPPADKVLDQG